MVKGSRPVSQHPPFGLALLAGVLLQEGHELTIIDGIIENNKQLNNLNLTVISDKKTETNNLISMGLTAREILEKVPEDSEIIGFSCMFSTNWLLDRDLIDLIGSERPKAICIAGGESITSMFEICLKQSKQLKICVLGEGEETISELLKTIENDQPLETVDGISYKQNGVIKTNARRKRLKTLEDIPIPPWELFHVEKYQRHRSKSTDAENRITLPILATRGCPYSCTFCTSPDMWGTRYYMRSPTHVANEIEYLKKTFGATNFEFYDLTAIIKKEWIIEFAQILLARQLDITWKIPAGTRSEAIDGEVSEYLFRSGCYSITYAPESGSKRLLNLIKKKVDLQKMLKSIEDTHEQNVHIMINMILGLPDETHSDIWKTYLFLIKCAKAGVSDLNLAMFRPYPGSNLFNRMITENKINFEKDDYLIESLYNIDSPFDGEFYNDAVSKSWYKIYYPLTWITFYGAYFFFKPRKFFRFLKNIFLNKSESWVEQVALHHLKRRKPLVG